MRTAGAIEKSTRESVGSTIWYDKEYLKGLANKRGLRVVDLGSIVGKCDKYFCASNRKPEHLLRQICELLDGDWDSLIGANFSDEYKGINAAENKIALDPLLIKEPETIVTGVVGVVHEDEDRNAFRESRKQLFSRLMPEPEKEEKKMEKIFDIKDSYKDYEKDLAECLVKFRAWVVDKYINDDEITPFEVMKELEDCTKRMREVSR